MKKILLTESQMSIITEKIKKNDSIQKLLFTKPSEITFKISGDLSDLDSMQLSPIIQDKEIPNDLVSISLTDFSDSDKKFIPNINVSDEIRELGIGEKMLLSLLYNDIPLFFGNELKDNEIIFKIINKLSKDKNFKTQLNGKGITIYPKNTNGISDDEKIYVKTLMECYVNNRLLMEGKFDIKRFTSFLFRGCKTFGDYAHRISCALAMTSLLTISMYTAIVKSIPVGTDRDKQELIEQIEDKLQEKESNVVYASSFIPSETCIEHLKHYEKLSLTPYYATKHEKIVGKKTIGWGHVITNKDPYWLRTATSITKEQADEIFKQDLSSFYQEFNRAIQRLPKFLRVPQLYTQGFIDAAFSILYNSGMPNFLASPFFQTWKKCSIDSRTGKIKYDDYQYTASLIKDSCITQNGKVVQGLKNRRNIESVMAQLPIKR